MFVNTLFLGRVMRVGVSERLGQEQEDEPSDETRNCRRTGEFQALGEEITERQSKQNSGRGGSGYDRPFAPNLLPSRARRLAPEKPIAASAAKRIAFTDLTVRALGERLRANRNRAMQPWLDFRTYLPA